MSNPAPLQPVHNENHIQQRDVWDPEVMLSLIIRNWYLFLVALILAYFAGRFYIDHTMSIYRTTATLLINETDERPLVDNTELLQGLGLPGGMRNLENQILILKSVALVENTIKQLPFQTEFYFKSTRSKLPVYPETPIRIVAVDSIPLPWNTEFSIKFLGNNRFSLQSEDKLYALEKLASFGDTIKLPGGKFRIECRDDRWLASNMDRKLYFTFHSSNRLVRYYSQGLTVEKVNREGSVLRISLNGANRLKDADFINKHIEEFQAISLNRKNMEADRRIRFIDNQLVGITDSLSTTETKLQQFRSANKVMDLSVQGQAIIGQVTLLENEKARLDLEANYYDYLSEYLSQDNAGEIPIVPITMGITDPGLTRLVDELAALQSQLSARGAGEMNPLQRNLEQRVRTSKEALRETLNGLRRANTLARSENQQQINRANAQASALPATERQLLGFERRFRLNDEIYTFLLETRAEQEMQKASNRADSEVIDPADPRFSLLLAPIPVKINLLGMFGAFAVTFLFVFLRFVLNKKVKEEEIRQMVNIPVIGTIPRSTENINTVVLQSPSATISEAYRHLRSKLQFFTKDTVSPIILVTSAMPGEGKTYTAINLASAYSLLGKRTILVGFDLRKPKIYEDFGLSNDKGVSTWLIGRDRLHDCIQKTSFENLSVIPAGPVPPNPSELTALNRTSELFALLKEEFDYIIIDSSPIGIVSDTIHLASMADTCLLIVRPGHTLRDMLEQTIREVNSNGIKGASLVINASSTTNKHYGYGEKYGYTKDKKPGRKLISPGKLLKS
jgi:capsular exopolysaccharide synthesis family protein